ncbi:TraX family protein [Mycoplasmatota bacterium WC44]
MTRRNDTIKTIAMLTMLIDHIGVLLFPSLRILRTIGRIAFPIFAYQVAKGYSYTSDKKKYSFRMFIFGLISQVPYVFLNKDLIPNYFHFNVMILFLYSLGVLFIFDLLKESKSYVRSILLFIALVSAIVLPQVLEFRFDSFAFSYSTYGILMILIFYIFDGKWIPIIISYICLSFISTYESGAFYLAKYSEYWIGTKISYFEAWTRYDTVIENITKYKDGLRYLEGYFFQARSIMALPIIIIFERFFNYVKLNKYIGYGFYPLHITILLIIRLIIGGPIS